jgi:tetratricopeptide (TPR) repeat protein
MPTVELSMIVKDGGADLARCLKSAAPFVDRIVVGDTGSSDHSRDIAREIGAEVLDVPWEQDFAKARNRVLDNRKCDWVLILDADEMLDPLSGENLRNFIRQPNIYACHHVMWNYVTESMPRIGYQAARKNPLRLEESRPYPAYVALPTLRLFRNHPGIYFEGSVHEELFKSVAALHLPAAKADIVLHHFGFVRDSEEKRRSKNNLYHALGELKLEKSPDDLHTLIEVGVSHFAHHKNPKAALAHFTRAGEIDPGCAEAWLYSGVCLSRLGEADQALAHLERAKKLGLHSGVLCEAAGDAHFKKGNFAEAIKAYAEMERRGEASPLTEAKRGASQVHLGQLDEGLSRIGQAVSAAPNSRELYDILAPAALLAGRLPLAVEAMQARIPLGNLTGFHEQLVAMLQGQFNEQRQKCGTDAPQNQTVKAD